MENISPAATSPLVWQAEEHEHHEKTTLWYIVFAVIAIGLLVFSFFTGSILTIITFVLIVVMGFVFAHRKPRMVTHQLTTSGVMLGEALIPYKNIKSFWIIYEPPQVKTLYLETNSYLNHHTAIQLGDQDPVAVKLYLKKYLLEQINKEESFVDIISRRLKI